MKIGEPIEIGETVDVPDEFPVVLPEPSPSIPEREERPVEDDDPLFPDYVPEEWPSTAPAEPEPVVEPESEPEPATEPEPEKVDS